MNRSIRTMISSTKRMMNKKKKPALLAFSFLFYVIIQESFLSLS